MAFVDFVVKIRIKGRKADLPNEKHFKTYLQYRIDSGDAWRTGKVEVKKVRAG